MAEEALGRGRETNVTGQRKGVAVKICTGSEDAQLKLQLKSPCVCKRKILLGASVSGAPFEISSSSLRVAFCCQ